MSRLWVFSDLHLGVQRTGGTTPTSADALRNFSHRKHANLLDLAGEHDTVLINGDLTDQFNIDLGQAIEVYAVAAECLNAKPSMKLVWSVGNHDLSKDSSKLGTVAFIGRLLEGSFPGRFKLITQAQALESHPGAWVIPHVANQDLFELELNRIPDDAKVIFLHVNLDHAIAGQSDHSLNLTRDRARDLVKAGKTLVLGHEHQGRTILGDKVIVVGNQFPTSVSDCLRHGDAQKDGMKYALAIEQNLEDMELVPTWSVKDQDGGYREVDWRDLASIPDTAQIFVRVAGKADASEAAEVIKEISKLRQRSDAYVITNAVKVGVVDGDDEIEASIEEIKAVSVIEILLSMLDEPQQAVVRELMKD